jgi:3-oxoacyl-[acyl-carrier protein] reductase
MRLATDGFAVALNSKTDDGDGLAAVAKAIELAGGWARGFEADITDEADVNKLVASISEHMGPVDTLVLNATGPQPEALLLQVGWPDYLDQLSFFVKSPLLVTRAAVAGMRGRGFGRIINIDSEVALRPPPGRSAYSTAKSAQIGLTMALARELAPWGITVNTVAPGFIPVERHADVPASERNNYVASVPAGRIGAPDDIAHAVSFFASVGAGFITGQRIIVDGGRSLC